jgi:transglutaminase-like putative cysteine protease
VSVPHAQPGRAHEARFFFSSSSMSSRLSSASRPAFNFIHTFAVRLCCFLLLAGACRATELSRQPPAVYAEKIGSWLTPLTAEDKARERTKDETESGMTLLDERIHFVESDGRRLTVWHLAYKSFTEAGAKSNAEDVFTYLREDQKFHLVTAETIQPDGTVLPVRDGAVLFQSPQRQADYALYDDQVEVRIIFPNVKAGSITHVIAVIEDVRAGMPNEYAHGFTWTSSWATGRLHYLVDLPAGLAERLKIDTLGSDVPEAARAEIEPGRVRYTWQRKDVPVQRYEISRAPSSQNGPAIHLSTIAAWNDVGRWFGGLLRGRDQLSPALASQVDEWTKGMTDRDEIIRTLLAKVANDVRYTGLELGQAAYQPHECNEVWANQYGDCKDKANLLATFLRHKSIPARVVLVNTNHLGLTDRRSPDYRVFTHAITAIPDGKGGYQFCDPTIAFSTPGMIGPGSADRDVFVITDEGGEWVRTPAQSAGSVGYDFDLELSATGELSGWMTVTSDGYYGAGQRERYRKRDVEETRRRLTEWVRGFFPGAEVMDAAKVNPEAETGPDILKAYFIVSPQGAQADGRHTLTFPNGSWLFPDLGTTPQRDSAYFLYQDKNYLRMTIKLPAGMRPEVRPEPYQFETPVGRANARWEFDGAVCRAELQADITQSTLTAQDFARYYQAVQSMRAWLEKPVLLTTEAVAASAGAAGNETAIDLPLMPTGEGQISLVDKRYPYEGNHTLRRAALERTLQYFPKDPNTVFHASVRIGFLDWAADKNQAALDRVLPLLANYRAAVSINDYAWAESLQALALRDMKKQAEALAIFVRIARDPALSLFRRSNETLRGADLMETMDDNAGAIALLTDGIELDPDKRAGVYQRLTRLLLLQNDEARVRELIGQLVQNHPGESDGVLTEVIQSALEWTGPDALARTSALGAIVTALVPQPGDGLRAVLDDVKTKQESLATAASIQKALAEKITAAPLAAWYQPIQDATLKTWADFTREIEAAETKSDPVRGAMLGVQAVLTLPVDGGFSARLERAAGLAEWLSRNREPDAVPEIFPVMLELCDRLPHGEETYIDGRLWRARMHSRQSDYAGERAIFQELEREGKLTDGYIITLNSRWGRSFENSGDFSKALTPYRKLEKFVDSYSLAAGAQLRAVFINLHLKKTTEALRIMEVLKAVPERTLKDADGKDQITELVALAKTGEAEKFWSLNKKWWPLWVGLKADQKLPKNDPGEVVPVIPNLGAAGQELGRLKEAKDTRGYFLSFQKVVSGARWLPSFGIEASALSSNVMSVAPNKRNGVYNLMIAMLDVPIPAGVIDERRRGVMLVAHLVDDQKPAKALKVAAMYPAKTDKLDALDRAMVRLRALAALGARDEREEAAVALEGILADPLMADKRVEAVDELASLYRAVGRAEDEEALLQRELGNAAVVANPDGRKQLTDRLAQLGGSLQVKKQMAAWVKAAGLDWYDYAEPASLADPRLRDLEETLKNPSGRFSQVEIIKLQLLAAQDPNRPLEAQQQAWRDAMSTLVGWTVTQAEVRRLVDSAIGTEGMPDSLKSFALWVGICEAASQRWPLDVTRWSSNSLTAQFSPVQKKLLPVLGKMSRIETADKDKTVALLREVTGQEINGMGGLIVQDLTQSLFASGETEAVQAIYEHADEWQVADANVSREKLRMEVARSVAQIERWAPLYDALSEKALAVYADAPRELPKAFAVLRKERRAANPMYGKADTRLASLYLMKTHQVATRDVRFWSVFMGSLPPGEASRSLALDLFQTALELSVDDAQRAEVTSLVNGVDMDDPVVRESVYAMLAPYREPVDAPATFAKIRLMEIEMDLRLGRPVDFETAFQSLKDPMAGVLRTKFMFRHALQIKDVAVLKRLVKETPTQLLINGGLLPETIPTFDLLEQKAEAKVARDACRKELRQYVQASWLACEPLMMQQLWMLAYALDEPEAIPAGWYAAMAVHENPFVRKYAKLGETWLHRDWAGVVTSASALIDDNAAVYGYYWKRGYALAQLGKTAEAIRDLTTYTHYSMNELEYPRAMELLAKLKE